jgi:peptidoglycan/xylan/chitin deacetylase (PgdA/CDA1 family)
MVSDDEVPHVSPLYRFRSTAEFTADLDYFLRRRRPISLPELLDAVRQTGRPPANSFLPTFDDGFREMHDIVTPLLRSKGVPAVFFISSATLDNGQLCLHQKIALLLNARSRAPQRFPDAEVLRRLRHASVPAANVVQGLKSVTWKQRSLLDDLGAVCDVDYDAYLHTQEPFLTSSQIHWILQNGMAIGAHSVDHPRYCDLSFEEQIGQTSSSMELLAGRFKLNHRVFAFPHTDRGVSRRFFELLTQQRMVDATFGTAAPARDSFPFSFQRFTMEKSELPAAAIVARNTLRHLRLRAAGKAVIYR